MPRYYFHIRRTGGALEEDPQGTELASFEQAGAEAVKAAQEILAIKVAHGEMIDEDCFVITSEDGTVLAEVPFKSALRFGRYPD